MSKTRLPLTQLAVAVASQLEIVEALRFDVTERQADSGNHNEQEALQAELDRFTAVATNLNLALEKLAA